MRLLVLGGTAFVGHAVVHQALTQGWEVTTFNRGVSGVDIDGTQLVRGDRTSDVDLARLAAEGPWDAAVDTSGYVPRNVMAVSKVLESVVRRYVFMSTVSVYEGWPVTPLSEESRRLECPPDADENYGVDIEDGPTKYGYQKAGCETAVQKVFGSSRTCVLRPGVVLGPREYVGRLPWWLRRIALGGPTLAPGSPDRSIQPVDVRDVALFATNAVTRGLSGAFNVTAPVDRDTFGELLAHCAEATGATPDLAWIPDERLLSFGVRQWSEIPLWRTSPGVWRVDPTHAQHAGLTCRPLRQTVIDTWSWLHEAGGFQDNERSNEIGINASREQDILAGFLK